MSTKTKLAIVAVFSCVILQGLTDQDPNGSLDWLNKFKYLIPLLPGAFATYGYDLGQASSQSSKKDGAP